MYIKTNEVAGMYPAIIGMRNPMNSWDRSDSIKTEKSNFVLGENDKKLAIKLIKAGAEHRKFLRQIQVWATFNMPRYWWSEFDTYKFNSKNSCSTMHKLFNTKSQIKISDFVYSDEDFDFISLIVNKLNNLREEWKAAENKTEVLIRAKRILPEGFLQKRTVNLNYEEIRNIYHQRKSHRLKKEWVETFCEWVESLPFSKIFIQM